MWQWGTADMKLRWAREQMDAWTAVPSPEAWRAVRDVVSAARDSRPGDPDAHEQLGRLYALRAGYRDGPVSQSLLRQARASYEQALRLRPASPYTWAGLAWVTHRLDDVQAFARAFERADSLGPWEVEVQMSLIDLGQQRWDRLSAAQRERTLAAARRMLAQQPRELLGIAQRDGWVQWLCEVLDGSAGLGRSCSPPSAR